MLHSDRANVDALSLFEAECKQPALFFPVAEIERRIPFFPDSSFGTVDSVCRSLHLTLLIKGGCASRILAADHSRPLSRDIDYAVIPNAEAPAVSILKLRESLGEFALISASDTNTASTTKLVLVDNAQVQHDLIAIQRVRDFAAGLPFVYEIDYRRLFAVREQVDRGVSSGQVGLLHPSLTAIEKLLAGRGVELGKFDILDVSEILRYVEFQEDLLVDLLNCQVVDEEILKSFQMQTNSEEIIRNISCNLVPFNLRASTLKSICEFSSNWSRLKQLYMLARLVRSLDRVDETLKQGSEVMGRLSTEFDRNQYALGQSEGLKLFCKEYALSLSEENVQMPQSRTTVGNNFGKMSRLFQALGVSDLNIPLRGVLWDLDQTLVRTRGFHQRLLIETLGKFFPLNANIEKVFYEAYSQGIGKTYSKLVNGILQSLSSNMGISIEEAQFATSLLVTAKTRSDLYHDVIAFPGVTQILALLMEERVSNCLVTGSPRFIATRILQRAGIESYFFSKDLICSDDAQANGGDKTSPTYWTNLRQAQEGYADMIAFEDNPKVAHVILSHTQIPLVILRIPVEGVTELTYAAKIKERFRERLHIISEYPRL